MPPRRKSMAELAGAGDDGTTGLLGGGRVGKDDLRVEAYGGLDEASSALGLARALAGPGRVDGIITEIQRDLYRLGAEVATTPEHAGSFARTGADRVARLDQLLTELEAEVTMPREFVLPGASAPAAAIDVARTVVRRTERHCVALRRSGGIDNPEVLRYLNRLSLVLFVLARWEEARRGTEAPRARG
jgi:cob(I)alamin adenosyltransferase